MTPLQELIEIYKTIVAVGSGSTIYVRVVVEALEAAIEKEKEERQRRREIVAQELHNLGMPTDKIKGVLDNL